MRLFITGATGLVGRRLVSDRLVRGDVVVALSRDRSRARQVLGADGKLTILQGDPAMAGPWQNAIAGCDAVINLAGAGVADRRWTAAYKRLIASSRVQSTHQIVSGIQAVESAQRPQVFINASAVGYYGDAGDQALDEDSSPGEDFLARVVVEWEKEAMRAGKLGVRLVLLRTAVVLDEGGGALKKMTMPFRFFAGGPIGSGRQFMPWIHWRDVIGLIDLALTETQLHGPLNAAAPQAVRNREFAQTLGRALHRPSWLPAPKLMLRIALGELANSLTASQRVVPAKALHFGYSFTFSDLSSALESLIETQKAKSRAG